MSASDRRAKLERAHPDLSIRRQCAMLGLARSSVYRQPRPVNDNDLEAMRRIDALYTERPFFGARRIARTLTEEGFSIDRKRARRLMRLMGIEALGPKPRTSKPAPGHKIYPYLLRGLSIERPNQIWAADITYIPIGRGFLTSDFSVTSGASFRMVLDVGQWDNSRTINTPGQSGDPDSAHYRDLAPLWANGEYVPLLYSRQAVEAAANEVIALSPKR